MYVHEYILRLSRNVLGLACCSAAAIYGRWSADNRLVWIGMLELTCGRLVGSWITGTERKHFRYIFSYLCFDYYRDAGNFSYN